MPQTLYCKQEMLTPDLEREISMLVDDYYHATVAKEGIPPYDFKWEVYREIEKAGSLLVTTARYRDRVLVGVCIYIILEHLHHRGLLVAECDTLATKLEFRGNGIGQQLYTYSEEWLRDRGVNKVLHRHRLVYRQKPLFEKMGFTAIETCYCKELD